MTPVKMLWRVRGGDFSKMELDVAFDPGDEGQPRVSLLDLPKEIQLKILHLLQPLDILALGRTCRSYSKYADNKQLWYDSKFSIAKHLILCAGVASGFFWARKCLDSRFPRSQALSSWAFSSRYESNSALFFVFFVNFLISKFYSPKRIVAAEFGQFSLQTEASTPSVYTAGCFSNFKSNS